MTLKIAIQPDEQVHGNGERQSFSDRWFRLADEEGIDTVQVDVHSPDIMPTLSGCDAFMWRSRPSANPRLYAKRLMYAVEKGLGIPVFPSLKSAWYFEDKIIQRYFLSAIQAPTPETYVFWERQQAERFCDSASYPFVLKLSAGYQASNVCLVRNRSEAQYYVEQLFGPGMVSLGYKPASVFRQFLRRARTASEIIRGRHPHRPSSESELHHGYFYAQEFLESNDFDTRVTVIGNRAFAFRRFNRPDDFRASGSGEIDWDPAQIEEDAVRLAFNVSTRLDSQTLGIDVLRKGSRPVIGELTLAYASWAVRDCPGHWVLEGDPETGRLVWVDGSMEPADAIFRDFVTELRQPV